MPKKGGGRHDHRKKQSPPKQQSQEESVYNEDNVENIICSSFTKDVVVSTSSLEEEKVLSWSECFQPESVIVNCRNTDSLLVIFSYLSLLDALQVGSTCRRLYHLYRASCHSRKSLVLIRGSQSFAFDLKSALLPDYELQQKLSEEQSTSRFALNQLRLPKFEPSFNQTLPFHRQLFSSTISNLSCLEITTGLSQESLSDLIRALNSLTLLEILKLFLNSCQEQDEKFDQMLNSNTGILVRPELANEEYRELILKRLSLDPGTYTHLPVYTLRLPVLRHLTLAIRAGSLFHERLYLANGVKQTSTKKVYEVKTAPNFLSLNCPLLSALNLSTSDSLKNICGLIFKHVIPSSRLIAGSSDVQVKLTLSESDDKVLRNVKELNNVKEALKYITSLEIGNKRMPTYVPNLLSLLMNLREICFSVSFLATTTTGYYSAVLISLSKLSNLKSLNINFDDDQKMPRAVTSTLAVLPTVTKLTIKYGTSNHIDVVKELQLVHCFPGLTNFSCSFNQSYCDLCLFGLASFAPTLERQGLLTSYSPGDEREEAYRRGAKVPTRLATKLQRCGKVLVRRLGQLKTVKPENRKITFLFKGKDTNLCYSPVNNQFIID